MSHVDRFGRGWTVLVTMTFALGCGDSEMTSAPSAHGDPRPSQPVANARSVPTRDNTILGNGYVVVASWDSSNTSAPTPSTPVPPVSPPLGPPSCSPGITRIIAQPSLPKAIDHDDTSVYWITERGVTRGLWKAPQAGGATANLAQLSSPNDNDRQIVVDDANVYVASGTAQWGDPIFSITKSGGSVGVLVQNPSSYPTALAVDGDYLYWTDGAMVVNRIVKTGGPVVAIATGENAIGIAVDETNAYWINQANQTLRRWDKSTGVTDTIATSIKGTLLRSDATMIFVADTSQGTIVAASKAGGPTTTLVAAPLEKIIFSMTLGSNEVYWTSGTLTTGVTHVWAVNKDGTGIRTLSTDRSEGITAAPNGVFWTNDSSEVKELCN